MRSLESAVPWTAAEAQAKAKAHGRPSGNFALQVSTDAFSVCLDCD